MRALLFFVALAFTCPTWAWLVTLSTTTIPSASAQTCSSTPSQSFESLISDNFSDQDYTANLITASSAMSDICRIELHITLNASETSDMYLEIRTDAGSEPGTSALYTSETLDNEDFVEGWNAFDFSSAASMSASTNYYLVTVLTAGTGLANGYGRGNTSPENVISSADGTSLSWTHISATKGNLYRIYEYE